MESEGFLQETGTAVYWTLVQYGRNRDLTTSFFVTCAFQVSGSQFMTRHRGHLILPC